MKRIIMAQNTLVTAIVVALYKEEKKRNHSHCTETNLV